MVVRLLRLVFCIGLSKIDTPWVHLDIAGKAWSEKAKPTVPKGGTGFGVRLLNQMIDDWVDMK